MTDEEPPFKLSKKGFLLAMTDEEREMLRKLAELDGVKEESNVLRRAIRCLMEARGLEIPEGLFADRKAGNRLPKSEPQAEAKPLGSRTGMGVTAPILA